VSTPRVTEIRPARTAPVRDDFADEPARRPRMAPYDRAAERAMIRASLAAAELHTHAYDRENNR
jgi:hypothetical protein